MSEQNYADVRELLYQWLDNVPFSRPKQRLARHFADASAVTEIINFFYPKFVYENAYPQCSALANKIDNWDRLNTKVLGKLGIKLSKTEIRCLAEAKLEYTEAFLCQLAHALYSIHYFSIQKVLEEQEKVSTEEDS